MRTPRTSYQEKFLDPRWQKKRLEILERDGWACQSCGDMTVTLHVHHRRYIFGHDPWEYQDWELITLCEACHEGESEAWKGLMRELEERFQMAGLLSSDLEFLIALVDDVYKTQSLSTAIFKASTKFLLYHDLVDLTNVSTEQLCQSGLLTAKESRPA